MCVGKYFLSYFVCVQVMTMDIIWKMQAQAWGQQLFSNPWHGDSTVFEPRKGGGGNCVDGLCNARKVESHNHLLSKDALQKGISITHRCVRMNNVGLRMKFVMKPCNEVASFSFSFTSIPCQTKQNGYPSLKLRCKMLGIPNLSLIGVELTFTPLIDVK